LVPSIKLKNSTVSHRVQRRPSCTYGGVALIRERFDQSVRAGNHPVTRERPACTMSAGDFFEKFGVPLVLMQILQ
jgi:hypothetical protein